MLFYKLLSSFKIDRAMNSSNKQVKFLSQSSDQIKNFGTKNGKIQHYLCNFYFTLRKGGEGSPGRIWHFSTQKMPIYLISTFQETNLFCMIFVKLSLEALCFILE